MTRTVRLTTAAFVAFVLAVIVLTAQTLTITPSSATLTIGQTKQLVASMQNVTWASNNPAVASVTATGMVSARTAGVATITAKYKNNRADSTITVNPSNALMVQCPANKSVVSSNGSPVAVTYSAGTTGGVAPITVAYNPTSGSLFPVGITTVYVTATSSTGQTSNCNFTVTVTTSGTIDPSWIQLTASSGSQYIQASVDGHTGATTFYLKAGTHVRQEVVPKSGNTFIGAPGAIMDGQNVSAYAFHSNNGTQSNVTIKNLEIKNYTTPTEWYGAITGENVTNWVVTDNLIHNNVKAGIRASVGTGWQVLRNKVYDNGKIGIMGYQCNGALFEGNELYGNNASQQYLDPSLAGEAGIKVFQSANVIIRTNNVHNNYGKGIWSDTNYPTMTIDGNTVKDNRDFGIWHEVGYAAIILNNIVSGNGFTATSGSLNRAGISVTNSPNVEIHHNTVTDNYHGISLLYFSPSGYPVSGPYGVYETRNAYIHDNTIQMHQGKTGMVTTGDPLFYTGWNNRWIHNTYRMTSLTAYFFQFEEAFKTWAQWQASGRDTTGTATVIP